MSIAGQSFHLPFKGEKFTCVAFGRLVHSHVPRPACGQPLCPNVGCTQHIVSGCCTTYDWIRGQAATWLGGTACQADAGPTAMQAARIATWHARK